MELSDLEKLIELLEKPEEVSITQSTIDEKDADEFILVIREEYADKTLRVIINIFRMIYEKVGVKKSEYELEKVASVRGDKKQVDGTVHYIIRGSYGAVWGFFSEFLRFYRASFFTGVTEEDRTDLEFFRRIDLYKFSKAFLEVFVRSPELEMTPQAFLIILCKWWGV